MSIDDQDGPTTVLSKGDPGLLAVAKSLLEAAGIEFVTKGENSRNVPPFGGWVALQVSPADAAEARTLLAGLRAHKRPVLDSCVRISERGARVARRDTEHTGSM